MNLHSYWLLDKKMNRLSRTGQVFLYNSKNTCTYVVISLFAVEELHEFSQRLTRITKMLKFCQNTPSNGLCSFDVFSLVFFFTIHAFKGESAL